MIDRACTWDLRRIAIGACVTLAMALAGGSVAADDAEARFQLSGGCEIHPNFCDGSSGDGSPSGGGWGIGGGSTGGGSTGGTGGGTAAGGALPEVGRGTTTCRYFGYAFECEYSDYRAPNGGTVRQCYWTEFGVRRHTIPCG